MGFVSVAGLAACTSFVLLFAFAAIGAFSCNFCGSDDAGFAGVAPFGLPLTGPALGVLFCALEGCDAAAAVGLETFVMLGFLASFSSKGDPLSIEPSSGVFSAKAAPPDTVPSSLGSAGNIAAVSSCAVETGLSGFALVASPIAFSDSLEVGGSADDWSPVTLIVGFAASCGSVASPFVFGLSTVPPSKSVVVGFEFPPFSSVTASLTPSNPFDLISEPMYPLGSTATKLVRTLDKGRELLLVTLPAGDRPREGGEVSSPFCSNLARREATPLGDREDMTTDK